MDHEEVTLRDALIARDFLADLIDPLDELGTSERYRLPVALALLDEDTRLRTAAVLHGDDGLVRGLHDAGWVAGEAPKLVQPHHEDGNFIVHVSGVQVLRPVEPELLPVIALLGELLDMCQSRLGLSSPIWLLD